MFYKYKGFTPVVSSQSFVHPLAAVTGNVIIGDDVYIGPGAAIRGDWGGIVIENGCNIQENCTVHMFPGITMVLEEGAHLGHGCVVHGAHIGRNVLIGMNAVIMDHAEIGEGSIIGALSFIRTKQIIPPRSLVVGSPAKMIKKVSDEMLAWKTKGTQLYQSLPSSLMEEWEECEPLREIPEHQQDQEVLFRTWEEIKNK